MVLLRKLLNSLRARLVILTVLAVALGWSVTAVVTWQAAKAEIGEVLWDHPDQEREEIAGEIAEHLVQPLAIALPTLAVMLVFAIGIALRPLQRLSRDIAERAPDRLDPLSLANTPSEAAPLINRLNELFERITGVLENERRFTADAAHELRTPLAAITAQAQVAVRARDEAERNHALDQLSLSAQRATHLLAQLLTLAKIDGQLVTSGDAMSPCKLDQLLIDAAAQEGAAAIAKHIQLAIVAAPAASIAGDPVLLQVLLRNLIDNAVRYTPDGGIVELSLTPGADSVTLSVRDNGPGIAANQRQAALNRFVRLAGQDSSGSGLGLAIVTRIAQVHGATLTLDKGLPNATGAGLDISIHFPSRTPAPQ